MSRKPGKSSQSSQQPPTIVTGFAWFEREQWERLREVAADTEKLDETYAEWVFGANRSIAEFEAQGLHIEKISIDIDALVTWCREQQRPVDSSARAQFAAEELRRRHQSE